MPGVNSINLHPVIAALLAESLLSRAAVNNGILAAGILLQAGLVFVLFRRGLARRFPGFTALITFYPLRACLLLALAGRLDADAYEATFNALALAEIALQAAVALELMLRLVRELGGWTLRRAALVPVLAAAACGLTWAVVRQMGKAQATDRVQVLAWFVMLALFAAILKGSRRRNLRCIGTGFAAFSLIQLGALAGRHSAMARHAGGAFVAWSYAPACGYLLVVLFWMIGLRRESSDR